MFLTVVLIFIATFGTQAHAIQVPCGSALYDPFFMACCGPLSDGSFGVFDYLNDICCGGEVTARGTDDDVECCNNEIVPVGGTETCCGTSLVDGLTTLCCQGNVIPNPGDNDDCCGTGVFDITSDMCCTGNRFQGQATTHKCCGQSTILVDQLCCNGQGVAVPNDVDDPVCCPSADGTTTVIDATVKCCNGQGVSVDGVSPDLVECCGDGVTGTDEICCDGEPRNNGMKASPQCCPNGEGVFDNGQEICCNGNGVDLLPSSDLANNECCGDFAYDITKALCCMNQVVLLTDSEEVANYRCCGAAKYNPSVDLCCGDVIGEDLKSLGECCGSTPFTPLDEQECCSGTTLFNPQETECCGGEVLVEDDVCCVGEKVTPSATEGCCNARVPFNPTEQKCCGPYLLPLDGAANGNRECCQEERENRPTRFFPRLFDPVTETCCRGRVQPLKAGLTQNTVECCSNSQYDSATQRCCRDRVYPIDTTSPRCRGL